MVSRGGRSKGCSNCRKRRVKCDEKRPTCSQCLRRRAICDGPKGLTWVPNFSPTKETELQAVASLPAELSLAPFEHDIYLAFTRKYLLRGGLVELACDMIDCSENSEKFATNPGLNLLRKSILSLSVTFFGRRHHQDQITSKGYAQYGQVLKQLNYHLTQPELQVTNETLLTASSCMLLEIFLPTGPTNFLKHQRGIEAIMQMRGPPTELEDASTTIFRGLRIFSIIGALADSRPSIYTRKEWKQIPPRLMTESGILQHRVFDILADCTRLIGERDIVLALGAEPERVQSLLEDLHGLLNDLVSLYPEWETLNRNEFAKAKETSRLAEELGIANHVSATVFVLYQAVYMCILQIQQSLCPSPHTIALRNVAAEKIANCLVIKDDARQAGSIESNTIGFVATKVVWDALGKFESPEGKKLAQVVKSTLNSALMRPYGVHGKCLHMEASTFNIGDPLTSVAMLPISFDSNSAQAYRDAKAMEMQFEFINIGDTKTQQVQ